MWRCSSVRKLGSIWPAIEPREKQQASEKSANVRLPGDRLLAAGHGKRAKSEEDVDTEPDNKEQ
jgi:hypothetical protein